MFVKIKALNENNWGLLLWRIDRKCVYHNISGYSSIKMSLLKLQGGRVEAETATVWRAAETAHLQQLVLPAVHEGCCHYFIPVGYRPNDVGSYWYWLTLNQSGQSFGSWAHLSEGEKKERWTTRHSAACWCHDQLKAAWTDQDHTAHSSICTTRDCFRSL